MGIRTLNRSSQTMKSSRKRQQCSYTEISMLRMFRQESGVIYVTSHRSRLTVNLYLSGRQLRMVQLPQRNSE